MGTRGYLFIRYRGRYFVYYNHFYSYPEGLGAATLNLIPASRRDTTVKWLESTRRTYGRLCQQFEERHLPVEATTDDQLPPSENHAKCFLALDDRLDAPPLQTLCFSNDLFIEWTYTIDLDRELFLVDSTAAFVLPKISCDMRQIKYLSKDHNGRTVFSKDTPEDIIGSLVSRPDVDSQTKLRYGEFSVNVVLPKILIDVQNTNPRNPHEFLMLTTFQAVFYEYWSLLDDHVLTWMPQGFSFREIAFALLSIAAGEVSFECPASLNRNYEKEGYLLVPDERIGNYQQKLLPVFLGETHLPGKQSGSAPMSTTFWFGSVLVYLVSRLDLLDVEELSVSKAVDTGLSRGLKSFHAVVFSILDFILVQAWVGDSGRVYVERSPLMNLFHSISKNSRDTPDGLSDSDSMERAEDDISSSESCTEDETFHGFMALVHFFDTAENQRVRGSKSRVFPNDILANIMRFSDSNTSLALAKTSACCREERRRRFPLGNDYNLVGFHRIKDGWNVDLEDKETGETRLVPMDASTNGMRLNLVIAVADATRQSIMRKTTLYLPGIAPKDPIFAKTVSRPEQDGYCRFSGHCLPDQSGLVLDMPVHSYPGVVEKAWGQYVAQILNPERPGFSLLSAGEYNGLLPHRHRELLHDYHGRELLAIVRCSSDESPGQWSETLKYAIHRLSRQEGGGTFQGYETRGFLVIVAFGTKVKPYYYAFHRENPLPDSAAPGCLNSEVAACVTDPDPVNRLLPALRGQIEPFDIKDEYPRKYLEHLVSKLGGRDGIDVQFKFDPATQSFVDCDSGSRND